MVKIFQNIIQTDHGRTNIFRGTLKLTTEKKFGLYPGALSKRDIKKIEAGDESTLFIEIRKINSFLRLMTHGVESFSNNEITEMQYAFEYCILKTKKYGVEVENPKDSEHVKITTSFQKWYEWWDNIYSKVPYEENAVFLKAIGNYYKENPADSWNNN